MLTGAITEFPTRGFSVLCSDDSVKTGPSEVAVFCVDTQISDGLERQGLSVLGSKESSGTDSVNAFRNVMQNDFHRCFDGQDSDRSRFT